MMSNKEAGSDRMSTALDQLCASLPPWGNYTAAH